MNTKPLMILSFIAGVAAGSVVTWHYTKKIYEEIAQKEIDSVKEVFSKRATDKVESTDEDKVKESTDSDTYKSILNKQGYANYSVKEEKKGEQEMKPYVIAPEQFGDNSEYEQISLTYYADCVLTDENDDVVEEVEETVGFESLNHFGEYEDDSVFVRNDVKKCDYEILLDTRRYYSEIRGNGRY